MIDPNKIDLNQVPKKFCDGAVGSFGKDVFFFSITSGNSLDSFATQPQVMKSISDWMSEQVKRYEEQYGEIDMKPQEVQSPIQKSNLDDKENKN